MKKMLKHSPKPWKTSCIFCIGTHLSPLPKRAIYCVEIRDANNLNPTVLSFSTKKNRERVLANADLIRRAPLIPDCQEVFKKCLTYIKRPKSIDSKDLEKLITELLVELEEESS